MTREKVYQIGGQAGLRFQPIGNGLAALHPGGDVSSVKALRQPGKTL
jgi:hypothetical protein